jgi:hypothetical protein
VQGWLFSDYLRLSLSFSDAVTSVTELPGAIHAQSLLPDAGSTGHLAMQEPSPLPNGAICAIKPMMEPVCHVHVTQRDFFAICRTGPMIEEKKKMGLITITFLSTC